VGIVIASDAATPNSPLFNRSLITAAGAACRHSGTAAVGSRLSPIMSR